MFHFQRTEQHEFYAFYMYYRHPSGTQGGKNENGKVKKHFKILFISMAAFLPLVLSAQSAPKDRILDGLKGNVKSVTEYEVIVRAVTAVMYDTISPGRWKYSSSKNLFGKDTKDSSFVEPIVEKKNIRKELRDTLYYCYSEYSREGHLLYRKLKNNNQTEYTDVVYLPNNKIKILERTYSEASENDVLRLFYYSDVSTSPKLENITVVERNKKGEAKLLENIMYEYENDGEACREHHSSPDGKIIKSLKYEFGYLTDQPQGSDTNLHYYYDENGNLSEVQVYDEDYDLIFSDIYDATSDYKTIIIRRVYPNSTDRGVIWQICNYENDSEGNWISRTDKPNRKRIIEYYD